MCEVEKIASESQAAVEKAEQRLQDKEEQIRELQEILENSVKGSYLIFSNCDINIAIFILSSHIPMIQLELRVAAI